MDEAMLPLLTLEEAQRDPSVYYANSYSRLGAVLALRPRMRRDEWLRLLGDQWSGCDNLWQYTVQLREALGARGPLVPMMSEAELRAYDLLPERVVIYRGAGKRNRAGISWTLSEATARQIPMLNRYRVPDPTLYTAEVAKESVLALKLDREEDEVITLAAEVQREERLINRS
jgi:hypothetical protein